MRAYHKVALNTGILYARMAITVLISLYATRVILNALGVEDFGIFNIVAGSIAMFGFMNASLASATQRFMSYSQGEGDEEKQKSIFNVSTMLHALIAFAMVIVLECMGWVFFQWVLTIPPERVHAAQFVYHFAVVSVVFSVLSVPYDAVINARENMLFFTVIGVLESVLKLAIAMHIDGLNGDRLVSYGIWMAAISFVLLIARAVFCHLSYKECAFEFKGQFKKPFVGEMVRFAWWTLLTTASSMIANYGQGLILNVYHGTKVNAAQGVSGQMTGMLGTFGNTLLRAVNPLITKSEGAGNRKLMLDASMAGGKFAYFLQMLFFVPAMIEMPYILRLWLKNPPEYAAIFCQLQFVRNLLEQLYLPFVSSISAVGNIRGYQIRMAIANSFPLALTWLLFKVGAPPYVMYVVFSVYTILTGGFTIWMAHKLCDLQIGDYWRNVLSRCLSVTMITAGCGVFLHMTLSEDRLRLASVLVATFVSGVIGMILLGMTEKERSIVISGLGSIRAKLRLSKRA